MFVLEKNIHKKIQSLKNSLVRTEVFFRYWLQAQSFIKLYFLYLWKHTGLKTTCLPFQTLRPWSMPWLIFNPNMLGIAFDWRLSVHGWGCKVTVHEFLLQLKLPWTYLTELGPLCRHHSFTGRYWGTHHIAHVQPYFIVWCYNLSPQAILLRVVKRVWHPMFSQWWDQFHSLAKSYDFKIEPTTMI
jgi:hypothetical protein